MKQNYKIKIGETGISDERIDSHKNFESVLQRYDSITQPIYKKPLYRNPRAFLGLVLILIIGVLVFRAVEEERKGPGRNGEGGQTEVPFVQPPFPTLATAPLILEITGDSPASLTLPNGMVLHADADAFGPGEGPVRLEVTLADDPADRLRTGIPANFDSPNGPVHLNSLALMEIRAFRGDAPATLADGKSLSIEWEGPDKREGEALYLLDVVQGKWIKTGQTIAYEERVIDTPNEKSFVQEDGFQVIDIEEGQDSLTPEMIEALKQKRQKLDRSADTEVLLLRKFKLDQLGIWDFAIPYEFTSQKSATVRFETKDGRQLSLTNVYMVSRGLNSVFSFWSLNPENTFDLSWDSARDNQLVAVDQNGRLCRVAPENFSQVTAAGSDGVALVKMTVREAPVQNIQELKDLLAFPDES